MQRDSFVLYNTEYMYSPSYCVCCHCCIACCVLHVPRCTPALQP
jgi:hypothetical protein